MNREPICLDIETELNGHASTEYYKPGFKVTSVAYTWRDKGKLRSVFYDDPVMIRKSLLKLEKSQRPVIVHNLSFELGVITTLFPDLNINWQYDTMRMCFLRDGEGEWHKPSGVSTLLGTAPPTAPKGLSLTKCAVRYLGHEGNAHKAEAYEWLEKHHNITKKHGAHLHLLPRELMARYNMADTEVTYLLWEDCQQYFKSINYSDRRDWQLYCMKTGLFSVAYVDGFHIDRPEMLEYIKYAESELERIDNELLEFIGDDILQQFEHDRIEMDLKKLKSQKNIEAARQRRLKSGKLKFNPGSGKQLADLLMKYCDIKPTIFTKKGTPSTARDDLWQWGEAGRILTKKGKLKLQLGQALGIYMAAAYDGKWHVEVKPVTTITNRVKGGAQDE